MSDTRRVLVTEPVGVKVGRAHYACGDTVTLDAATAAVCIARGWAEDAATGESGERVEGAVEVGVDDAEVGEADG